MTEHEWGLPVQTVSHFLRDKEDRKYHGLLLFYRVDNDKYLSSLLHREGGISRGGDWFVYTDDGPAVLDGIYRVDYVANLVPLVEVLDAST